MPRVTRSPRNSVNDRPARLKLLLRRQKRLLRPGAWAFGAVLLRRRFAAVRSAAPGGALARLQRDVGSVTAFAGLRVSDIASKAAPTRRSRCCAPRSACTRAIRSWASR